MKKVVVALLIALVGIAEINAQVIRPETNEFSGSQDLLQETKSKSNLLIKQISDAGKAIIAAEQEMAFSNKAFISQNGNNHKTQITQTGNGNEASLFSEGGYTTMNVTQAGNNNSIFSNLSNNTLQLFSTILEQKGNGNNIELTLLGNSVIPQIERVVSVVSQTGNDLHFSGTYNSPDLPVQIDQKSGTNGAGMSVGVTTSAFYFPMKTD